jgi:hydroxymethylglutaryl-CoA lyase
VPSQVAALTDLAVDAGIPLRGIAFHFHDTRGTALANVAAGLDAGVRCFDSSTGGTGGCPYAPGAAGNLATEDLVYFLDASGWDTGGVSLGGVLTAARFIADALGRTLATKVGQAGGWDPASGAATRRA